MAAGRQSPAAQERLDGRAPEGKSHGMAEPKKRKKIPRAAGIPKAPRAQEEGTSPAREAREARQARDEGDAGEARSPLRWGIVAVVALALGAAGGWIARGASGKADVVASPDPAASGEGQDGVCGAWAKEICEKAGEPSEGCAQAKSAAGLLPASACAAARGDLEGTVAKLKTARSSCDSLVAKLCADLGEKSESCAMVREKTPSFPAERCKEMLGGYDAVLQGLKEMERENAPISEELAARQASGEAPSFGPPDAKVTIVEYSDFECPYCSRAAEVAKKLKEKYGSKVRFVFRQYPLSFHENAQLAAEASLAAHAQGKFWPFHDLLFENQDELDRKSLEAHAQKVGLDLARFKKALDSHEYAAAVKADMSLAEEARVSGTPTMFIGTDRVANPTELEAVARLVDAKLAAAK